MEGTPFHVCFVATDEQTPGGALLECVEPSTRLRAGNGCSPGHGGMPARAPLPDNDPRVGVERREP